MAYFDRFDICEAHYVLEIEWNVSGILQERPSNRRRRMSTDFQLSRMQFKSAAFAYRDLSDNGKEIYQNLCARYGFDFKACPECGQLDDHEPACAETNWDAR